MSENEKGEAQEFVAAQASGCIGLFWGAIALFFGGLLLVSVVGLLS